MIRPELRAAAYRLREVIAGGVIIGFGLWVMLKGGYILPPLGAAITAFGLGWTLLAYRRQRFAQTTTAPGVVEIDEGQVTYLAPQAGGSLSINDLAEIRLLTLRGRRVWRLKQLDGQALLIPIDASGAETLFDAFSSLPEMNTATLVDALTPAATASALPLRTDTPEVRLVWRRRGTGVTTNH